MVETKRHVTDTQARVAHRNVRERYRGRFRQHPGTMRTVKDSLARKSAVRGADAHKVKMVRQQLKEGIIGANELFRMSDYVLSDELSLVDCTLGPLMWRLAHYGVKLGKPGASVEAYAHRIFSRPSFKTSLTQAERDLMLAS